MAYAFRLAEFCQNQTILTGVCRYYLKILNNELFHANLLLCIRGRIICRMLVVEEAY